MVGVPRRVRVGQLVRSRAAPLATALLAVYGLLAVLPVAALPLPTAPTTSLTVPTSLPLPTVPLPTLPSTTVTLPILTTSTSISTSLPTPTSTTLPPVTTTGHPSGTTQSTLLGPLTPSISTTTSAGGPGASSSPTTGLVTDSEETTAETPPRPVAESPEIGTLPEESGNGLWAILNGILRPVLPPGLAEVLLSPLLILEVLVRAFLQTSRSLLVPILATAALAIVAGWRLAPPWIYAPHERSSLTSFLIPRINSNSAGDERSNELSPAPRQEP